MGQNDARMRVSPAFVVVNLITLVLSITVHEFGHAIVADKLGDGLPRSQGRVTLNPLAHADPIGTIAFPLISMIFAGFIGFGWGRPVMVRPISFTRRLRMRTAHLLVAAAGPTMNLLFALFISLVLFILYRIGTVSDTTVLYTAIMNAILLNFVLAFFNLIPTPPLDGGTVLAGLLPDRLMPAYEKLQQFGMFILFAFLLIPSLLRILLTPAYFLFGALAGHLLGLPPPQVPLQ
jgi:Zn-dependent protease